MSERKLDEFLNTGIRMEIFMLKNIFDAHDVLELIFLSFSLRELSNHLNHGEVPMEVLQKTVGYAVSVLEAIYEDETK